MEFFFANGLDKSVVPRVDMFNVPQFAEKYNCSMEAVK